MHEGNTVTEEAASHIICATYTHARRHPMVLGNIAGWTPPFQLSVVQLAVLGVVSWVEVQTWRWWGSLLPHNLAVLVAVLVPCVLAWAVRRARFEGRSLVRAVVGWMTWLASSTTAHSAGRPYRPARATAPGARRVFIASDHAYPRRATTDAVMAALPAGEEDRA